VNDISSRRRADEARAHLAAIVESSDDAIIGVSSDGVITSWNRGAERLDQYPSDEAMGTSVFTLIPPELLGDEKRNLERVLRGESVPSRGEVSLARLGALKRNHVAPYSRRT
jgi:PAS domain S-box-containing protein